MTVIKIKKVHMEHGKFLELYNMKVIIGRLS